MKKVSILIPCYNEEESIPLLYSELIKMTDSVSEYEWEMLFVNDGSKDNTLEQIKQLRITDKRVCYVELSRNFGKENAMLAGFDYVTGDCTIILDADLQHPPAIIPQMIKEWESGYDDVYAKRNDRPGESILRKKFSVFFYKLLQKTTNIPVIQDVGDFRLLDKSCILTLRNLRENQRYTKGLYGWIGFRKKEILFEQQVRIAGNTKWSFYKLLNLAIEGITSFTTMPLRIATVLGSIVSVMAFIYMFYIMIKTFLFGDDVQGFPTLMIVILFLGGVQLLSIGIIGEYLGRIFNETKNRPPYIAREYNEEKVF